MANYTPKFDELHEDRIPNAADHRSSVLLVSSARALKILNEGQPEKEPSWFSMHASAQKVFEASAKKKGWTGFEWTKQGCLMSSFIITKVAYK